MSNTEVMPMSFEPGAALADGTIPLCVPELHGNEWLYVKECLDTNWVSSAGPFVSRFEESVASYVGAKHAVATVNGTASLHVALIVAGVQPDDEVIMPALTFIAPANAIRYVGAWPVFIDIEPNHWQLDPQKVEHFIAKECQWKGGELRNRSTGRRVKAILPVDILGHPVDLDPVISLARKFDLSVVEDATESLGAKYKGTRLGQHGDVVCFSFNGNKIITTGGGGMIVTQNDSLAERARYLTTQAKDNPIEYVHLEVGFNYRLTNLQAAVGCAQMEQLDKFVTAKRNIAGDYLHSLADVPGISAMVEAEWAFSAHWLFTVLIDGKQAGFSRGDLFDSLTNRRIQARPLWQPLHRSPAHAMAQAYHVEVADAIHGAALSLPSSVGLTEEEMARVVKVIRDRARQVA
jgi:perosamine synthetase